MSDLKMDGSGKCTGDEGSVGELDDRPPELHLWFRALSGCWMLSFLLSSFHMGLVCET